MNRTLSRLLRILKDEIDLYEILLGILEKEKNAVIHAKFNDVDKSLQEKEKILAKLKVVENKRSELVLILQPDIIDPKDTLTLSKIIDQVEEPYVSEFKKCRSDLKKLVRAIQVKNQSNRNLFQHSLDIVKNSIGVLSHLNASSPVYCPNGKVGNYGSNGTVLMNEI